MQRAPKVEDLSRDWELSYYDSRYDHSAEKRMLPGAIVLLTIMYGTAFGVFAFIFTWDWTNIIPAVLIGIIFIIIVFALLIFIAWSRYPFEVSTFAYKPPEGVIGSMDDLLPDAVKSFERRERTPGLRNELVRYTVSMGWQEEALVIIAYRNWSQKDHTKVVVRSSENMDEWGELRAIVEEAIANAE